MLSALRYLLLPVTAIYAAVIYLRNRMYDFGLLKSDHGKLPTIVIGNLALGGTGKTPMTEYLIRLLENKIKISILSRGYGRKTKGFVEAVNDKDSEQIGDEPLQIHLKFPDLKLAVCEDRHNGINEIQRRHRDVQLVILDDAFQHRKLRPDFSILLTSYSSPYWNDIILPTGNLRDNVAEVKRADVIVVTKCPPDISDVEMKEIRQTIYPAPDQQVFFATIQYGEPVRLSGPEITFDKKLKIRGLAGIANPEIFENYLKENYDLVSFRAFRDHHIFSQSELESLKRESDKFAAERVPLVVTEKDAMRLMKLKPDDHFPVYYIPMQMQFVRDAEKFNELLLKVASSIVITE